MDSFSKLAKESTTLILPGSGAGNVASAVAEAMGVFQALSKEKTLVNVEVEKEKKEGEKQKSA